MGKKYLKVTQVKSRIGRPADHCRTLDGLGLKRRGRSKILEDTPSVRGMIRKVCHLVAVEENVAPAED